jgi:hypothetical protein
MTAYKKAILEIVDEWSKAFFSKQRDADVEKIASALFSKFKYQVENDDEISVMFMLLKIMMAEGVMLDGTRQLENRRTDA